MTKITEAVANLPTAQNGTQSTSNTLWGWIEKREPEVKKILPTMLSFEQFKSSIVHALNENPALLNCTPGSFIAAMMTAAQLGLRPNTPLGHAYLIPYASNETDSNGNKIRVLNCQFQLGWRGMVELAHRTPGMMVDAQIVYANDDFVYELGLEPKLKLIPAEGDRGKMVKAYGIWKTTNGNFGFEVMSEEQIRAHAKKHSNSYGNKNSAWQQNFEEMAKKTVLKRALKYAPLEIDIAAAIASDENMQTDDRANLLPDRAALPGDTTVESTEGIVINDAQTTEGGVRVWV